eukprot:scaffold108262_cov33-Tisochrysis_lutea.AAC.1
MAHDAFSSRHFADEGEAQLRKSDAVLIRQPGSSAGSPPRFSLFVFGTEYAKRKMEAELGSHDGIASSFPTTLAYFTLIDTPSVSFY